MTDEITGAELLADVYEVTGKFIAYPSNEAHVAHVLWIVNTHLMEAWESTPRLAFLSPEPASGKTTGIEDRDADVLEPLLAIADALGAGSPERARGAAPAAVGAARDPEPSLGIKLLADLKTLFDASTLDATPTEVILSRLTELPESPWGALWGKPINDRKLGRRLREYGAKSKVIRVGDRTARGYLREDLHDAWLRYLPAHDAAEAQQAQQVQREPGTGGFSQKNVAQTEENERNGSATSATDVADGKRNSPP